MPGTAKNAIARFGSFEVNLATGELRKSGIRLGLPDQAFQILNLLLENRGNLVSREDLRLRLWSDDTFVDFERGLNRAVNKLREALHDSADVPRFIETVPRRGYRFIAPLEIGDALHAGQPEVPKSLAIIPFTNASSAADADPLCAGIAESLIYKFAELPSLRVMASTTVSRYRNSALDAQSIGRELQVDAVLTGRVMLHGDSLKVGAELVDVRDGALLWGHQFNRKLADWFEVQEEMSRAIFEHLRLSLTQQQISRVQKRHTSSLEAHQLYLRGVFNWNKREAAAIRRAIEFFQQALEADPAYAPAYAGLADCFVVSSLYPYCFVPPSEAMPRAKAAALRALELDPELAEAHCNLGLVNLVYEWNFEESEKRFHRARDLKPSYPTAHLWYSIYCVAIGEHEQAQAEAEIAHELDPLSAIGASLPAITLYYNRQFQRALDQILPVAAIEPSYALVHLFIGYAECALNRLDRAIDAFTAALKLSPPEAPNVAALSHLAYAYGLAGEHARARDILRQLEEIRQKRYVAPQARAFVHLGLGEFDAALNEVENMVRERSDYLIYLNRHVAFDPIRDDQRFMTAMDRLYSRRRVAATN